MFKTIKGVVVETPYIDRLCKFLDDLPQAQFNICRNSVLSGVIVILKPEVKTVCKACGSPDFLTKIVQEYSSYIDPTHFKIKKLKILTTTSQTTCAHCKLQNNIIGKVH